MNAYGRGKILLASEYLVLHGAQALALPTRLGQAFDVKPHEEKLLHWQSKDPQNIVWFDALFEPPNFNIIRANDIKIATTLQAMLLATKRYSQKNWEGTGTVVSQLEFERHWGLGSSSSLVYFLGLWGQSNPYRILEDTLGGSGYDIAAAAADGPILYTRNQDQPLIEKAPFNPAFKDHLIFVYRNKKKNSQKAIKPLLDQKPSKKLLDQSQALTDAFVQAATLEDFQEVLVAHEKMIASYIGQPTLKETLFADFGGAVKSLGAWGGDFILAASKEPMEAYFNNLGYTTQFRYSDFIL